MTAPQTHRPFLVISAESTLPVSLGKKGERERKSCSVKGTARSRSNPPCSRVSFGSLAISVPAAEHLEYCSVEDAKGSFKPELAP